MGKQNHPRDSEICPKCRKSTLRFEANKQKLGIQAYKSFMPSSSRIRLGCDICGFEFGEDETAHPKMESPTNGTERTKK